MKVPHSYRPISAVALLVVLAVTAATAIAEPVAETVTLTDDAAANGSNDGILKEPCLISACITSFIDGSDAASLRCVLQGSDVKSHGRIRMKIEGLTAEWALQHHALPAASAKHTLFLDDVTIDTTVRMLKLPDGKTIDDMQIKHHLDDENENERNTHDHAHHPHGRTLNTPDVRGVGDRTFLIVQVVFQNNYTVPKELIQENIFDAQPNFTDQFAAMSFGKLSLSAKPTIGTDDGILTVQFPPAVDPGTSDTSIVIDLVTGYLVDTIEIFDDFDHFIILTPFGTQTTQGRNWVAFSQFGGKFSIFNGIQTFPNTHWAFSLNLLTRHLGTNFGLGNSNWFMAPFQDTSGAMGDGVFDALTNGTNTPLVGYNGAKSWELGWYSDQTTTLTGGQNIDFERRLCGVVDYDPADTTYDVIIRIDDPDSELNYYIAFNRASGFNADSPLGRNQVLVTSALDLTPLPDRDSELLAILNMTEPSYRIADTSFPSVTGIIISVTSIDDDTAPQMCATVSVKADFSRSPSTQPSTSAAPSTFLVPTVSPTISPTLLPTSSCGSWRYDTGGFPVFVGVTVQSFRFDVAVFEPIFISGMSILLPPYFVNMPYTIFYRPSTWEAEGEWLQIASGNNGERDAMSFTDILPFDAPLFASPDNGGVMSFRIDMANHLLSNAAQFPAPMPELLYSCPNCPFEVFHGQGSLVVGDNPPNYRPGQFMLVGARLEFCDASGSQAPTETVAPTATISASPTAVPSAALTQSPTASCRDGKLASLPTTFVFDFAASIRHDIEVLDSIDITGMRLVLPRMDNQSFAIFYRPGTWNGTGAWTELASGTIEARGASEFTDSIPFDPPLSLSESDEVVALRVDTETSTGDSYARNLDAISSDFFECDSCPFIMYPGMASAEVGENPDPLYTDIFEYFMGSLEFCNANTQMPSSAPSASRSTTPSTAPSTAPSSPPTNKASEVPSMTVTSAPTSSPTSSSSPPKAPSALVAMIVAVSSLVLAFLLAEL